MCDAKINAYGYIRRLSRIGGRLNLHRDVPPRSDPRHTRADNLAIEPKRLMHPHPADARDANARAVDLELVVPQREAVI